MSLLSCSHCGKPISATHKQCPHCGRTVSMLGDIVHQIESNKLWLAAVVILAILLLGIGWYVRMDSGSKWPLYIIIVLVAPVVPWLLQLAYKNAAPTDEDSAAEAAAEKSTDDTEKEKP